MHYNKKSHITQTKYFKFGDELNDVVYTKKFRVIFRVIFRLVNVCLKKILHIKLSSISADGRHEQWSYPSDMSIIELKNILLVSEISIFLHKLLLNRSDDLILSDIIEYDDIFRKSNISNLNGGMGYNNGLFVFIFTRATSAELIIESGVWRGFTTGLLDVSSGDHAKLHCFDINLSKVEWKSSKAIYYEKDISEVDLITRGKKCLALFDDHVSQFDRLNYCHNNGVKNIIFDDDVSIETVHSDGWPPIPTANMVIRYDVIPHKFKWISNGKEGFADISGLNCEIYKSYIYETMPDIFNFTGYKNSSVTSFLRLID
jgi:hypothetical protein